jgi:CheY-like chemotaxis protein
VAEVTSPSILIIDDDVMNREILQAFLEESYNIATAHNGKHGIEAAIANQPALIILDVNMPDMDGFTVCEHLKEQSQTQAIPVLFITGYDSPQDIQHGKDVGASGFLSRPFDGDALLELVAKLIQEG